MKKVFGNTAGLKARQIKQLQNLLRRRVGPDLLVSPELARDAARLSHELKRQIGLLIDRQGNISQVLVGQARDLLIPELPMARAGRGRLKGLRLIHTHLNGEPLTDEDLTDMALLRLDLIAAVAVDEKGDPRKFHVAHLLPQGPQNLPYQIYPPMDARDLDMGIRELIRGLEGELALAGRTTRSGDQGVNALLVSVTVSEKQEAKDSMEELMELARSSGVVPVETMIQYRKKMDSRFLLGKGKLRDLTILALQKGADMVIFDHELNPSQITSITDRIEMPVIDRTQLILDIFAQRAMSREGKLQVELAQLKYALPRLAGKGTALSRLAGGIGGRGPGETKLEIDRRRVRERITRLERELAKVSKQRHVRRARRKRNKLPVVSIVGYTNAGKSTLLNTLTKTRVLAESRLFATLDPASRKLRFPRDREVVITDTVGFIKKLPKELITAFKATLEELESADILLHVIDASNPRMDQQVESVERILKDLKLDRIPNLRVLNKMDLVSPDALARLLQQYQGLAISARERASLGGLIDEIERMTALEKPDWDMEEAT